MLVQDVQASEFQKNTHADAGCRVLICKDVYIKVYLSILLESIGLHKHWDCMNKDHGTCITKADQEICLCWLKNHTIPIGHWIKNVMKLSGNDTLLMQLMKWPFPRIILSGFWLERFPKQVTGVQLPQACQLWAVWKSCTAKQKTKWALNGTI